VHDHAVVPQRSSPARRRAAVLVCWTVLLCGLLSACTSTVERITDPRDLGMVGFLQAGPVARQEVEGRLGAPAYTYEGGRIVIYLLRKNREQFDTESGRLTSYRLVLVYGQDEKVDRWSLVDVAH